ncbi:MAG: formate dehydrogenase subunit delta [Paracoccaceae bacterium]|jgi:formate dehydrogenase subunit delta
MSPEKMIRMANQIATFFETRKHDEAVAGTAAHISDFWEPRMRKQLFDHIAAGGQGLKPLVIEAAAKIRPVQAA